MSEIGDRRLAAAVWRFDEIAVAALGLAWVAGAAFLAVPAVLIIDGFIYHAMIDAFARNGSLFVWNGYETYGSEALRLHLLRDAGGRLAPQYPGGWGIFAAPFYQAAGLRGVILVNAVASALTLPLIWQAARALFDDRGLAARAALIYGLASFAVDYALGVWPHGITTFLVTAALAATATGWRAGPAAEPWGALVAGLALGAGANFRVDALFAAAPLAVWLLGAGRRPYAALGLLLAGLAPGLAIAAAINQAKFGVFLPVTYGTEKGATSFGHYARLAPLAAAAGLAALTLGMPRVRALLRTPRLLAPALLGALGVLLLLPATREVIARIAAGLWVLVVDFQAHPLPALGMTLRADGTVATFGVTKKALLQSLPYAAVVLLLVPRLWRGPDRAALALCFLVAVVLLVPFAYGTWHGGASTNMRYFLNLLPALAILTAAALREIGALGAARSHLGTAAMVAVAGGALLYGALRGYAPEFIAQATLPNMIAGSIALLVLAVLGTGGRLHAQAGAALGTMTAVGLVAAFLSGWFFDLWVSQHQRASNLEMTRLTRDLPPDALVALHNPKFVALRLNRPPALTAQAGFHTGAVTPALAALVERAFAEGRPVFAQGRSLAAQLVALGASARASPRYGIDEERELYRMAPPEGLAGGTR